jgi:hypothetical protein
MRRKERDKRMGGPEQRKAEWEAGHAERKREGYAFVAMDRYLYHSKRRMKLERYITAMFGCKTSWPRIEDHGKYYTYGSRNGGRRAERPENGGNWAFNPTTSKRPRTGASSAG